MSLSRLETAFMKGGKLRKWPVVILVLIVLAALFPVFLPKPPPLPDKVASIPDLDDCINSRVRIPRRLRSRQGKRVGHLYRSRDPAPVGQRNSRFRSQRGDQKEEADPVCRPHFRRRIRTLPQENKEAYVIESRGAFRGAIPARSLSLHQNGGTYDN